MLENGKISPRQTGELMFITILATAILFVPAITAELAGHDAWLATLAGSFIGLVTLWMVTWLGHKHPGQTLFAYAETILGKWLGKLLGLAYVWLFVQITAIIVREFGDFMTTSFMPNTPLSAFNLSLLVVAVWAVLAGLEVISRMNEFLILLLVTILVSVILLSTPNWELTYLLPFFANGPLPILVASAVPSSFMGEIILLATILPFMTRPERALLAGGAAVVGSAALLTLAIVGSLAVFGPELVASFSFPLHLFVRSISIGQLLTRFEVLVMVTWVAGVFIKTSVFLYCASLGLAEILGLSQYRPVVLPLGIIITVFSISFFQSVVDVKEFIGQTFPPYFAIFSLGLPSLLIVVTVVREKIFGTTFTQSAPDKINKG